MTSPEGSGEFCGYVLCIVHLSLSQGLIPVGRTAPTWVVDLRHSIHPPPPPPRSMTCSVWQMQRSNLPFTQLYPTTRCGTDRALQPTPASV